MVPSHLPHSKCSICMSNEYFTENVSFLFVCYKFIYFWLHWVFTEVRGLPIAMASLVAEHGL